MNYRNFAPLPEYQPWLEQLKPRTCLVMHWLADLGAVVEPGPSVRYKALRFADKQQLLSMLLDRSEDDLNAKALLLLDQGDLDIYVAWLLWLRFVEYVPRRFVLPGGREKVLAWVRQQLRRPELTDAETVRELTWQAEQIEQEWHGSEDDWARFLQ